MARIVFDLDGTLVHSAPSLAAAGNAMLAELGRAPLPERQVVAFVGLGAETLVRRMLEAGGGVPGSDPAPHLARFRAIYDADPVTGTHVYPGVRAALARLAEAGHGMAVCTQKARHPAARILRALELSPPISGLTGGDSLDALKPDPRMLAHAAAQIGSGPVVLVGDSPTDAETARRAGVPFLLHGRGYWHGARDAVKLAGRFEDFADLPDLIDAALRPIAAQ